MQSSMTEIRIWAWMSRGGEFLRGHGCCGRRMQPSMDAPRTWACCGDNAVEHGGSQDVGMGVVRAGCSGGMDGIRVCAWMWFEWGAIEHGCNQDVGKSHMVVGIVGAWTQCWSGHAGIENRVGTNLKSSYYVHGCPGHRTRVSVNSRSVL